MNQLNPSKGNRDPSREMPKWLIYGLLIKGVVVTLIVFAVLWWSGVI